MTTSREPFRLTGWHVLVGFTAFFVLIAGLDVGFAVMAYRTFPGQAANDPYEAGVAYNRTLAQHRAQAALGWRAQAETAGRAVRLTFTTASGAPVAGLRLEGTATRPATESGAVILTFTPRGEGVFEASSPGAGAWDVDVVARDAQGRRFEAERRLSWR